MRGQSHKYFYEYKKGQVVIWSSGHADWIVELKVMLRRNKPERWYHLCFERNTFTNIERSITDTFFVVKKLLY
jgi:hypothetical protein